MKYTTYSSIFERFNELNFNKDTWAQNKELKHLSECLSNVLDKPLFVAETKWLLVNNAQPAICKFCNNFTPFRGSTLGYQLTCSIKCSRKLDSFKDSLKNPETIRKRQESTKIALAKFGVTNPGQLQKTKDKIKNTMLERYGVTSAFKSPAVLEKIANTNIEKYGTSNVLKSGSSIRQKLNKKLDNKKLETIEKKKQKREERKKQIIAKYGKLLKEYEITNLEKYGSTNPWGNKDVQLKIKATNEERYGAKHPAQNKQIASKITKTKIDNYANTTLKTRLTDLALLNTIPDGWDENSYPGGMVNFKHLTCSTVFSKKFYSGDLPKCPKCQANRSSLEELVSSWLKEADIKHTINDREAIKPKELDILTDKVAIEINGIYWHHDDSGKMPLLDKTKMFTGKLLHFWDYEIENTPSIVRSIILAKHGVFEQSIFARKCTIKKIKSSDARVFFDTNHLQGHANSQITYGLEYNNELIFCISFGKPRWNKNAEYEIIRLASKKNVNVLGGASRLLKAFIADVNPASIISYSDKRISSGEIYAKMKFDFIDSTKPNYFWFKGSKRLSRYETQKHKLKSILEDFDPNLSESQNMKNNGWKKCSDCGNDTWILKIS